MVSSLPRDPAGQRFRLHRAGVITCVVVDATAASTHGDLAEDTMMREGAAVVMASSAGFVGAFRLVTDAVRATLALRTTLPASRIALCAGETGVHGEFASIADRATRLASGAEAGSTVLSKLAGVLAMDHLPRDRTLHACSAGGASDLYYELLDARPVASPA
jgi:hypothetical protein